MKQLYVLFSFTDCLEVEMPRQNSVLRNGRMKSRPKDSETNNDTLHEEL